MRICFVSQNSLNDFQDSSGGSDADIVFAGFGGTGEISYEKEIKGETEYLEDIAVMSANNKNIVVSGCITSTEGIKRKSAVIAENGRVLGISDMLNSIDSDFKTGAELKVYETKIGKIGICVAEDLFFPEIIKTLAVCGSDIILCPYLSIVDNLEGVITRAAAFYYGVPICLCGNGYSYIADIFGETLFASPLSPIEFSFEKNSEYHIIETRQRGFSRQSRNEF